jgi:hypothetical protein
MTLIKIIGVFALAWASFNFVLWAIKRRRGRE